MYILKTNTKMTACHIGLPLELDQTSEAPSGPTPNFFFSGH